MRVDEWFSKKICFVKEVIFLTFYTEVDGWILLSRRISVVNSRKLPFTETNLLKLTL